MRLACLQCFHARGLTFSSEVATFGHTWNGGPQGSLVSSVISRRVVLNLFFPFSLTRSVFPGDGRDHRRPRSRPLDGRRPRSSSTSRSTRSTWRPGKRALERDAFVKSAAWLSAFRPDGPTTRVFNRYFCFICGAHTSSVVSPVLFFFSHILGVTSYLLRVCCRRQKEAGQPVAPEADQQAGLFDSYMQSR